MKNTGTTLRLGTRDSLLARTQSRMVADALERAIPHLQVELILIKTSGDLIQDRPLHQAGGKGLFTKELELALLREEIDFAVHSFKDVPVTMPLVAQSESELVIASVPEREEANDVLAMRSPTDQPLKPGTIVGTSSLRRQAWALHTQPQATILPLRGNIDTRIRKLQAGDYDVVIMALAGLKRAGLFDASFMQVLPTDQMIPASAQGALALQCRRKDAATVERLRALNHEPTMTCVQAERELVRLLNGDCHSPIGAFASIEGSMLRLSASVAYQGGRPPLILALAEGPVTDWSATTQAVYRKLLRRNAQSALHGG